MPVLSNSCNVRMVSVRRRATRFQIPGKQMFRNWLLVCQGCDMSLFDLLKIAAMPVKYNELYNYTNSCIARVRSNCVLKNQGLFQELLCSWRSWSGTIPSWIRGAREGGIRESRHTSTGRHLPVPSSRACSSAEGVKADRIVFRSNRGFALFHA